MDTLSRRFEQKPTYDVVIANPPFAGYVDKADINDDFRLDTTKTELLFAELFYNLLRVGGKAAVIVPNGVLFGSSNAHVKARRMILENCDLQAVISMPSGVFQPYSGVGTAILVFVKGAKTDDVWFYDMKADGYSLDQKRDFIDGKGNIPDIIERFKAGRAKSGRSLRVSVETIRRNDYSLSISRYRRVEQKEVEYEEPEALIESISRLEEEIARELQELRGMM
jgi:type I restriction enzyme M protein